MILSIERVKLAAAEKQMNFTEVLKLAHISSRTAKRIQDGYEVQTKTAGKLAAVLGVSVADLLLNKI